MRRLISVWFPTLATCRLTRTAPAWRADPLVTAAASGGRRVLMAANRAARDLGLAPGLAVADARARYPQLRIVEADPAADAAWLAAVADGAERYSPHVAIDGADGLLLDVTGVPHLFGGEAALLDDLLDRLAARGIAGRGALAETPAAAEALARYGDRDRIVVPPNGARAALAPLPVAALRLDPALADTLFRLGLKTIGDLYAVPRAALTARFGPALLHRLDRALGARRAPISPRRPVPALRVRLAFVEPVTQEAALARALDALLADLCRQLERDRLGARRLELALHHCDGSVGRLAVGTGRANRDPAHLARLFAEPLSTHVSGLDHHFKNTQDGIEILILSALSTAPFRATQTALAGLGAVADPPDVAALLDRLSNRLGRGGVFRLAARDSHIPERAVVPRNSADTRARDTTGWRHDVARPLVLLARPEPVEVVAEVPDGPPARIRWRGQSFAVRHAAGPERIAAEWWREAAPTRDYYRVEDAAGRRLWLYRAGLSRTDGTLPRWHLHGLFA